MMTPAKKIKKPPFPYDRPLSWSQISSFVYRPSQWYNSYVLGEKSSSPEMTFGSFVDKKIQEDPKYLPAIKREKELQHKLCVTFSGLELVGIPDALDLDKYIIRDYKTGKNKWDKKRADETGQITMYLLMIYLIHNIKPESFECYIDWMETHISDGKVCFKEEGKIKTFKTKRTLQDVLKFGQFILDTREKMVEYWKRQ